MNSFIGLALIAGLVKAQLDFDAAPNFLLDGIISSDVAELEKDGQATCHFHMDEILVFFCDQETTAAGNEKD